MTVRRIMLLEAVTFMVASLVHLGVGIRGYEHPEAHLAEAIIALVLLIGLTLLCLRPAWTRAAGLIAQGFALLGTLVGLFTIAVGVGPRTVPDVLYHVIIVAVLAWGILLARRA